MATKTLTIKIDSDIKDFLANNARLQDKLATTGSAAEKVGASFTIEAKKFQEVYANLQASLKSTGVQLDSLKTKEVFNSKGIQQTHVDMQLLGTDLVKVRQLLDNLKASYGAEKGFLGSTNTFRVDPASLAKLQQDLLTSSKLRLDALDRQNLLENTKTKYGETSKQAIRQQALNNIAKLEEEQAIKLQRIRDRVASGSLSETRGLVGSQRIVQQYNELIAAQQKYTRSTEELHNAHMNLFKFIGVSTIYWNVWHTALYRTRDLLASIPKVGMELETSKSVLEATMGGKSGAELVLSKLHDEAKRTGIQIDALRETWRTFSASTTIAGESVNTSWKIFQNMNTVVTALHYSGDKANHIFMALAQMFNKSKVQSEELVKQLGNLLPGAFAAFAKANGKTTQELVSQMKKGQVFAHETLLAFSEFYSNKFAASFAIASHSLNSEIGRTKTAFTELGEALYAKVSPSLIEGSQALTAFADKMTYAAERTRTFENVVNVLKVALEALALSSAYRFLFGATTAKAAGTFMGIATGATVATAGISTLMLRVKQLFSLLAAAASRIPLIAIPVGLVWAYDKATSPTNFDIFKEKLAKDLDEVSRIIEDKKPKPIEVQAAETKSVKQLDDDLAIAENGLLQARKQLEKAKAYENAPSGSLVGILASTGLLPDSETIKKQIVIFKESIEKIKVARKKAYDSTLEIAKANDKETLDAAESTAKAIEYQEELKTKAMLRSANAFEVYSGKLRQYDQQAGDRLKVLNADAEKANASLIKLLMSPVPSEDVAKRQREDDIASARAYYAKAQEGVLNYLADREAAIAKSDEKIAKNAEDSRKEELTKRKEAIARSLAETKDLYDRLLSSKKDEIERLKADKTLPELERNKLVAAAQDEYTATLDRNIAQLKEQLRLESTRDSKRVSNAKGAVDIEAKLLEASQRQHLDYQKLQEAFDKAAAKSGVPVGILKAQAYQESKFDTNVVSSAGAVGFSQFMPAAASRFGLKDRTNPYESIRAMGDYMAFLMGTFGQNIEYALAAYNTGEGNLGKALARAKKVGTGTTVGELNLAKETKDYVPSILGYAKQAGEEGSAYASILAEITAKEKERNSAISEGKELSAERNKIFQDFSQLVASTEENYLALIGEQTKESAKWNKQAAANEELVKSMLASGNEQAVKDALRYNQLTQAAEKYQEVLEKIQDLQNKSVVDFIPYKERRAELERMQSAGLESSFTAGWQKDKIALAEKSIKEAELRGQEQQLERLKASILKENPNADLLSNDKYVEQLSAISDLKIAIADLGLQSQSTFLNLSEIISSSFDQTFRGLIDGSITAGNAFRSFASGVVKGLAEIAIQAAVAQLRMLAFKAITGIGSMIMGGLGGLGGLGGATSAAAGSFTPSNLSSMSAAITPKFGLAKGGAFDASSNIVPFAKGGIVPQPTLFKFAKGTGLMGEAGAEAIMPLARDSQGRLGVRQQGSGNTSPVINNNYVINVTVDGSKGESPDQLGGKVAAAIMRSIAKEEISKANQLGGMLKPATRKVG